MVTAAQTPLRRIDWRFLLPRPFGPYEHMALFGGDSGVVERIKEVGLARRVSRELPDNRTADLVVILSDAGVSVKAAISCLQPGGLLYWEVDRRAVNKFKYTPAHLSRVMHTLGFDSVTVYSARPNFEACQFYFPMQTPASIRWFMDTLYVAQTPLQRVLEQGMRLLVRGQSTFFSWLLPDLAVVVTDRAGSTASPTFLNGSKDIEGRQETSRSPFFFTDAGNRLVMLPFHSSGEHPEVVIKIPKLPSFNKKNEDEQKSLDAIRAQLSPAMRRSVPEPLGLVKHGDITVGRESFLRGESLLRSSGRWGRSQGRKIEDLTLVAGWLAQFHEQTERERAPWAGAHIAKWVETPIAQYRRRFGANAREERLFEQMKQQARQLLDAPFPIVWQHRDFNVWNIFRDGDTVMVLDWEGGQPGLPLCDLLHFVTHWNEVAGGRQTHEARLHAFERLFFLAEDTDRITAVVWAAIHEYMTHIALDRRFLPVLLVYTWLELALRRFEQQRAHSEIGDDARVGNRNVDYVAVLADHADALFTERTAQGL